MRQWHDLTHSSLRASGRSRESKVRGSPDDKGILLAMGSPATGETVGDLGSFRMRGVDLLFRTTAVLLRPARIQLVKAGTVKLQIRTSVTCPLLTRGEGQMGESTGHD